MFPPYAKSARVVADALWVRCGQRGWEYAKAHPERGEIVWPAKSIGEHDWSFVRGFHVYVVLGDTDPFIGLYLVRELQDNGATVDVVDWDFFGFGKRGLVSFDA